MLKLIHARHGRKGILKRYQHARLGVIEIVVMHGKKGSAAVIHISDVKRAARDQRNELQRRQG